jgi:hypothetical protein
MCRFSTLAGDDGEVKFSSRGKKFRDAGEEMKVWRDVSGETRSFDLLSLLASLLCPSPGADQALEVES